MKLFFLGLITSLSFAFECQSQKEITWNKIQDGVEWSQYDLNYTPYLKNESSWSSTLSRSVTVRALKIDLSKVKMAFHRRTEKLDCNPTKERMIQKLLLNQNKNAIAAINSNFYIMNDGDILGLAIDQEKIWSENFQNLTISSTGIFTANETGTDLIKKNELLNILNQSTFEDLQKQHSLIVQGYPRLLLENELQISDQVKEDKRSRTSIGQEFGSNYIILTTIDAAGENLKTGMSLFEYAHMLRTKDCGVQQEKALNLDGGGSTAFAIPSENIYKQADRCRNLGNILTILPK